MKINQGTVFNMKPHISLQGSQKIPKSTLIFLVWELLMRVLVPDSFKLLKKSEQSQSSEKVSYNNQVLVLSENDAQKFVDVMQNPPKPSRALIALLKGGSV